MELSVVRIHKAIASGGQPWVRARSVVHPDKYLSQCPFILLNEEFHPPLSEFAIRSHDGVCAMTQVLDGDMEQADGNGSRWRLGPGDADFSTGRAGVLRAGMSGEQGVRFLHLWVNMPPSLRPNMAQHRIVRHEDALGTSFGDASALLYAGSLGSAAAAQASPWPITIAVLALQAGARASLPLASTERSFAYVLGGAVDLGRNQVRLGRGSVAWPERTVTPGAINPLRAQAVTDTRMLFISSPVIGGHAPAVDDAAECATPAARQPPAPSGVRYRSSPPRG